MTGTHTGPLTSTQMDNVLSTVYNSNLSSTHKITRFATIVIAASDASDKVKSQADYVCTGSGDQTVFITALSALPTSGGSIKLSEGIFQFGAMLTLVKDNVEIVGSGYNTYIKYNSSSTVISVGTQKNSLFRNFRVDYGGIDLTTGTKWVLSNIWRDNPSTAGTEPFLIDFWSEEHLAPRSGDSFTFQTFKHPLVKVLDDFETDVWTATAGTNTYDTTIKLSGTRSMKIVTPVGADAKIDAAITADLTDCAFGLLIYTPDATKISSFKFLVKTTLAAWTHYIYDSEIYYYTVNEHWHMIVFPRLWQSIGSPDLSQVNLVRLWISPVSGQQATIYVDKILYWKRTPLIPNGAVTFTFDDGMPNVPAKAKPVFDKYNYSGVFSQIINKMDATQIANARMMQSTGWDICSHSYDHDLNKSLYDPAWQYLLAQKWLADNGFKTGSGYALLNNGVTNKKMIQLINDNLVFARSSTVGYNALPCIGTTVASQCIRQTTTVATIKGWIDIAKANGLWLNLMLHDIKDTTTTEYDCSVATLTEVIDYCNTVGVEVLTFTQVVDRIKNRVITNSGSGTITSGTTSVNVRHGFTQTPKNIILTPTSVLGNASSMYISTKNTGTGQMFTVSVNVDPGQNITFDWQAVL